MIQGGFDTLNSVLKPFLNVIRIPKFKSRENGKYKNYPSEENKTIYLSSAWMGDHWSYDLYKEHREKMLKGEDWFTCNLPYQLSAYHGTNARSQRWMENSGSSSRMASAADIGRMRFSGAWRSTTMAPMGAASFRKIREDPARGSP